MSSERASGPQPSRAEWTGLAAILTAAAALRFAALDHGIPYAVGVDEPQVMERAVNILRTGDYNPHFFDYPGFYIYLQFLVAAVRFVAGASAGLWANLADAQTSEFYLWGRAVTAIFGTATVAVVYFAARRLGRFAAALAATLLAFQPMHVRESHYVLTDVPMTFFVALTMLLTFRAVERQTTGAWCWAGVAAGLAAGTKYNGGLALVMPLLTLVLPGVRGRVTGALAAVGGALVAFLAVAPYTIVDLQGFLNSFAALAHLYGAGLPVPDEPGWLTYLKHLRINIGWSGLVLSFSALVIAVGRVIRGSTVERAVWSATAVFAVLSFTLVARQRLIYGRYLLPMLPAMAVLSAAAVAWMAGQIRARVAKPAATVAVAAALTLLAAGPRLLRSIEFVNVISKPSTHRLAYDWLVEHTPVGTKVVLETHGLRLPPDRFEAVNVSRLIQRGFDYYQAAGFEYVIASSQVFHGPVYGNAPAADATAYRDLFRRLELVVTFEPSPDHPGPELRIYRLPS